MADPVDWPPPSTPYPQGVTLIGGPDHGRIAPFGGSHIECHRNILPDGRIVPAGKGTYQYHNVFLGMSYDGLAQWELMAKWVPSG
jgi:hypothetical protein